MREETKEQSIRVVLVEPGKYAREAVIGTELSDLQEVCGGWIQTYYPFEEMVCIVCNDEGKLIGTQWFKDRGQWGDNSMEPAAGMIIFFDWDGDNDPDHVGIVEYTENGVVHTIEGNSGDTCRQRQYSVGNGQIYGYGSVHESLVLPDDGSQSIGDLKAMVMEVNATQVDPVDRLSDDVYHYDAQDKVFEKAQDFESRMAEKVAVKDADRKPSLRQKLETKKQESKEQEPKIPKAEKHRSNDAEL